MKSRMRQNCLLISMLFSNAFMGVATVLAGPDEITNRLLNENVSMLDFGVMRLQMRLDTNTSIESSSVVFDWDKNVIKIRSLSFGSAATLEALRMRCDSWFDAIRGNAGINIETGQLFQTDGRSYFAELFEHSGWEKTIAGKTTGDVVKQLDAKFELEYLAYSDSTKSGEYDSLVCTSTLIEKGYSIKEKRNP